MAEHSGEIGALAVSEISTHSPPSASYDESTHNSLRSPKITSRNRRETSPRAVLASPYPEWRNLQPIAEASDVDLLLCLLSAGGRHDVLRETATRLLVQFGTFAAVIAASPSDLAHFGGLAQTQIFALKAIQIAAFRMVRASIEDRPVLADTKQVRDYLMARLGNQRREELHVLFLNASNRLIADEIVATGTVNWVSVKPRQIVESTLKWQATALIISHNHPSGDPSPSVADITTTERIIQALTPIEVLLYDHLIIARSGIFSFREANLLLRSSTSDRRRSAVCR